MAIFIRDFIKNKPPHSLSPTATVQDAVALMVQHGVGAVMIVDDHQLKGVFTERDLLKRVVGTGKDPKTTTLSSVMTLKPDTLTPDKTLAHALQVMSDHNYRHVPIVDEKGEVLSMISIRDLYSQIKENLENELRQCEAFVAGSYGGQV